MGITGAVGFVLLRGRAHRLLLAAALLTVLLTTAVLATLAAYSGAIGDAALRHSLRDERNAADTALIVKADVTAEQRAAADRAVRDAARRTFDGLPVTVRTFERSGPYALPAALRPKDAAGPAGEPDLTHFAALDPAQVRMDSGTPPTAASASGTGDGNAVIEAAVPHTAAERLGIEPGDRLSLTNRLSGPDVRVLITGVYRPATPSAPYWQLDDLQGRGIKQGGFTTYGPLLAARETVTAGAVSAGQSGWLATADYSALTTARIDALRESARTGAAGLRGKPELSGTTAAGTGLPAVLDRIERSLLVSRSTLLIVALQLVLLAGCALLLVARLLSAERAGETRLLRARGGSRARVALHAAMESLLIAVPALLVAPLLAGPLTRLLAGQGALDRIGLRLDVSGAGDPGVWLVAAGVALGCALAVTLPALASVGFRAGRPRALPGVVRAGADLALLVVAGVAYWQLSGQTSGVVADDRAGHLGVDPLLVAAPALALLAGTVLTLRLLPPVARLAERRATGGRGLAAALAGWQLSRRPMRGAGPVLLLVLALALGMLAIGQGASWERSQDDQADFRAGAPVRVLAAGEPEPGRAVAYGRLPGVASVAPASRGEQSLSGNRTGTVLALDTGEAADSVLMRSDLSPEPVDRLLSALAPKQRIAGAVIPDGSTELRVTASLSGGARGADAEVLVTVVDAGGTPYDVPVGQLPADGRPHVLTADLRGAVGPLTLTTVESAASQPIGAPERHRLTLRELAATAADGTREAIALPEEWTAKTEGASADDELATDPEDDSAPTPPKLASHAPPSATYSTGYRYDEFSYAVVVTVRLQVAQPKPAPLLAVATDRYLDSTGARAGQRVDITLGGETLPVKIVRAVPGLPTTPEDKNGGMLLVDLRAVNQLLHDRYGSALMPTEWWLGTDAPGDGAAVAAALRARPDLDPGQVVVRDEIAAQLRDDPFGAGPEAAFTAAAGVAAALAAVGFAVSAAGSLRERDAEFAVLRALGAPRRRLARTIAAEQGVLVGLALLVGAVLGVVLARTVIPLIVLTSRATRPVPEVLVELPPGRVAVLLAAVTVTPLLVTAALALRRTDPVAALREGGE
ncbi:FtsX-like permease family protein [Streptomyces sp. NPDC091377]|uniref:ABC transporter permease n=1 Tax=Streptomyces sp. NPDC091377 TaxID=3365995 RepID=UPI0037F5B477